MSPFTINVTNKTDYPQKFFIFPELPSISNTSQNEDLFGAILQSSQWSPGRHNDKITFTVNTTPFAICSTSDKDPRHGSTKVRIWGRKPVYCASAEVPGAVVKIEYTKHRDENYYPRLYDPVYPDNNNEPAGGFIVQTPEFSYPTSNNLCIGLGSSHKGEVMPMYIIKAKPQQNYTLYPITKIFVGMGDFEPGMIVNYRAIQYSAYLVEFKDGVSVVNLDLTPYGRIQPSS